MVKGILMSRNIKISKEIIESRKRFNNIIKVIMESESSRLSDPINCDDINAEWSPDQSIYDTGVSPVTFGDENAAEKVSDFYDTIIKRMRCLRKSDTAMLLGGAFVASFKKEYMERLLDKWGVSNTQVRDILSAASVYIEYNQWPAIASSWKEPHEDLNGYSGCEAMSMALIRGAVYEVGVMTPARINQARALATSRVGRIVLGIFGTRRAMETARLAGIEAVFEDEGELGERVRHARDELKDYLCELTGIEDILNTTEDELLDIISLPEEDFEDQNNIDANIEVTPPPEGLNTGSDSGSYLDDEDEEEEDEEEAGGRSVGGVIVTPPPSGFEMQRESLHLQNKDMKDLASKMIMAAKKAGIV